MLALWQREFEPILAGWVDELRVPILHGRAVAGFAADEIGVDVQISGDTSLRAEYLVGCDGGRSLVRKAAGIDFPELDPSVSYWIAEVEMDEEPKVGMRREGGGIGPVNPAEGGGPFRVVFRRSPPATPRSPPCRTSASGSSPCTERTSGSAAPTGSRGSPT